jgi:hypothetical protein
MSKVWQSVWVFLFIYTFESHARTFYPSARHLGKGNTFLTTATGMEALLLNSSLLALNKTKGYNFTLLSTQAGFSSESVFDVVNKLKDMNSYGKIGEFFDELIGDPYHFDAGLYSGLYGPFFTENTGWGSGLIGDSYIDAIISKSAKHAGFETLNLDGQLLVGGVFAVYYAINENFAIGGMAKTLLFMGADFEAGVDTFDEIKDDSEYFDKQLKRGVSTGYDLNMTYQFPSVLFSPRVAAVLENIGGLSFNLDKSHSYQIDQNLHLGASGSYKWLSGLFAAEFNYTFGDSRRDKFFQEARLGLSYVYNEWLGLNTGLMDGYPSFGVSLMWSYFQMDFAAYTVEMGPYPGAVPDQRIVMRMVAQI